MGKMNSKEELKNNLPGSKELSMELKRELHNHSLLSVLKSTIYSLIIVAAIAVLAATLWFPVLQIYGSSMVPTVSEGNIVLTLKGSTFKTSDIIAFYYNNKILVKRVIANAGEWVDIDQDGNVYVNNELIDEPYIKEKAFGEVNIEFPYQVPDGRVFVLGDNRAVSIDSRNTAVGCVAEEQIVGKLKVIIWPLDHLKILE